jgi:TolB-like protein/tetratricopeptide (TPR) repeat protein
MTNNNPGCPMAIDHLSPPTARRLAAILAADVVGYSRLVSSDEADALTRLGALRRDIIEPNIAKHSGRLFKIMGDGFLAEFASAVQAVTCAIAIQTEADVAGAALDDIRKMRLRIGIHVGDVVVEGDDLMGDGVNIAARLESIAAPGGISISRAVHDQVRDRIVAEFGDKGEIALKNIARSVQVFALLGAKDESARPRQSMPALALPDKPSIAVLPFQNMSGDVEQEYFADGMVEDITTALSRIKWLFVIARNSSFIYKGKAIDIKQVGRELGVRYVLEGSVRKAGNRVRITGQLIDAESGTHLWADRFDGDLDDVFDLQDKITESVIGAVSPKLQQSEFERSNRKPPANLTAYDYYLRGCSKLHLSKREVFVEAQPLFRKAIELDPDYAVAYATAAFWHVALISFGWSEDRAREVKDAIAFARKALELNKDDALVLTQAGYTLAYIANELEESADLLKRAVTEDPNYALAWNFQGLVNVFLGNYEDAIVYLRRALRLSPFDPWVFTTHNGLAYANLFFGRYDEATEWAETSVRVNPDYLGGRRISMACHSISGRIEAAKAAWEVARRMDPTQRISDIRQRYPIRRDEDVARLAEGFRLAGMPE